MSFVILENQKKFWIRTIIHLFILSSFIFSLFTYPYFVKAETDDLGAIQGQINDKSGTPLANIQVLATEYLKNSYQTPSSPFYFPYSYPPWTPEGYMQELIEGDYFYLYFFSFLDPSSYPAIYRTQTQADGSFLLEGLPEKRYILWAYDSEGTGYIPSIYGSRKDMAKDPELMPYGGYYSEPHPNLIPVRVFPGETTGPMNMIMEMGGILAGRITDEGNGSPIEGAVISIIPYSEIWMGTLPSFNTDSDSNGDFMIAGLAEGKYMVFAGEAEGYIIDPPYFPIEGGGSQENIYEVFVGQTTANCDITLKRGGEIWGLVTNQANGDPISDVFIFSYEIGLDAYYYPLISKTDPDGAYRITGLDGDCFVMIHHSDNFQGAYYPNTQDPEKAEKIRVELGGQVGPIDFQLVSYPTEEYIHGQVVEEGTGLPLSGMIVTIINIYYGDLSFYSNPDADKDIVPVFTDEEGYPFYDPSFEPSEPPPDPLDFPVRVFTDEEGRFTFRIPENGLYQLEILDPANIYLRSTYPDLDGFFEMSGDQTLTDIQVTMKRGGCLEGQVLDGFNTLAGIDVKAIDISKGISPPGGVYTYGYPSDEYNGYGYPYSPILVFSDVTDTEGWFHICGLQEGEFILLAQDLHDRGYMPSFYEDQNMMNNPQALTVSSGSTIYDAFISMKPGFSLTGRVVDQTGNPLANIKINAILERFAFQDTNRTEGYEYLVYSSYALTQEDGTYILTGLAEGTYTITAIDPDYFYVSNSLSDINVSSLSDGTVSDLILSPGGILSGKITNTDGQPLEGIEVRANPEFDFPSPFTGYGAAGDPYGDPNYGSPQDYDPNAATYSEYPYGDPNEDPVAGGYYGSGYYGSYLGPVYDPNDTSVYDPNNDSYYGYPGDDPFSSFYNGTGYGMDFMTFPYYSPELTVTTKADGTFQIKGLPAGDYRLEAYDPKGYYLDSEYSASTPSGSISLAEGEEITDLDFILSRGGTIKGVILDSGTGDPLEGFIIKAKLDQEYNTYYSTPSDDQGNYTFQKLHPGAYSFYALQHNDYQPQYYSGATRPEDAALVEIMLEETHEGIDFNLVPGIRLSGTVKDALTGQAITEECTVRLNNDSGSVLRTSYPNSDGGYQFRGLPFGTYSVRVIYCQGYYPECYRGPAGDSASCVLINVSGPDAVEGIDLFLYPKASISGQVVDESDQEPLSGKWILAIPLSTYTYSDPILPYYGYGYGFYASGSSAVTDPNGRYTIKGLDEGDYRILAKDPWYVYAGEYYNGIPQDQWDQADIIHLEGSESRTGIDFELQVGDSYSGDSSSAASALYYPSYAGYGTLGSAYYGTGASQSMNLYASYGYGFGGIGGDPNTPSPGPSPGGDYPEAPAPEIISEPEKQVLAGRSYFYQIQAEDPGKEVSLTYYLREKPEGMSINPESGLVYWAPSNQNAGKAIVQVAVNNDTGQVALQSFRLQVDADYTPPGEIRNLKATKGNKKVTLSWTPSEDIDGDLAEQILYIEDDKGHEEIIELDESTSEYIVKDLNNDQRYSFTITTRDKLGNESEGVIVTATPMEPRAFPGNWLIPGIIWGNPADLLPSGIPIFPIDTGILPFWSGRISQSWPPFIGSDLSTPTMSLWNMYHLYPIGSLYSLYPLSSWFSTITGVSTQYQWPLGRWYPIMNLSFDLEQPWGRLQ